MSTGAATFATTQKVAAVIQPADRSEVQQCVRQGFTSLLYAEAVGRLSEGRRTDQADQNAGKKVTVPPHRFISVKGT